MTMPGILNIDTIKARNLTGVKAVVTAAEAPRIKIGPHVQDEDVLAVSKVRFAGDYVAAVAAVDEDTAEEALSLIKVEYAPLPAVFDGLRIRDLPITPEKILGELREKQSNNNTHTS